MPGAAQLLEVLSAVLQGVKLPFKEEHVEMVERVLVPLHRWAFLILFTAAADHKYHHDHHNHLHDNLNLIMIIMIIIIL